MDKIKSLPGANRLIRHLKGHGVPMALASNSSRANIESKISFHQGNNFFWFMRCLLSEE